MDPKNLYNTLLTAIHGRKKCQLWRQFDDASLIGIPIIEESLKNDFLVLLRVAAWGNDGYSIISTKHIIAIQVDLATQFRQAVEPPVSINFNSWESIVRSFQNELIGIHTEGVDPDIIHVGTVRDVDEYVMFDSINIRGEYCGKSMVMTRTITRIDFQDGHTRTLRGRA